MIIKLIRSSFELILFRLKKNIRLLRDFLTFDPWVNLSWSQEGEDMVLRRIFGVKKKGFYVDVGAHHPKRFSNTYFFYRMGWSGINIEAMPGSIDLFNKLRPRDINLNIGIGCKETILDYFIFNEPAINSFDKRYSKKITHKTKYFLKEVIKIEVMRLDKILDVYLKKKEIDFLNIDVEHLEFDVLKSNDWSKYRPKFVLVEILDRSLHDFDKHPIAKFMKKKNYLLYGKQVNTFFFKKIEYNF